MSSNQLHKEIEDLIDYNANTSQKVDAILQAVIESLPPTFRASQLRNTSIDGYNHGIQDVKAILTAAMSTGGDE